jgi:hypothetical protein
LEALLGYLETTSIQVMNKIKLYVMHADTAGPDAEPELAPELPHDFLQLLNAYVADTLRQNPSDILQFSKQ